MCTHALTHTHTHTSHILHESLLTILSVLTCPHLPHLTHLILRTSTPNGWSFNSDTSPAVSSRGACRPGFCQSNLSSSVTLSDCPVSDTRVNLSCWPVERNISLCQGIHLVTSLCIHIIHATLRTECTLTLFLVVSWWWIIHKAEGMSLAQLFPMCVCMCVCVCAWMHTMDSIKLSLMELIV